MRKFFNRSYEAAFISFCQQYSYFNIDNGLTYMTEI